MFVTILIVKKERSEERSERIVLQFIKLHTPTSYLTKRESLNASTFSYLFSKHSSKNLYWKLSIFSIYWGSKLFTFATSHLKYHLVFKCFYTRVWAWIFWGFFPPLFILFAFHFQKLLLRYSQDRESFFSCVQCTNKPIKGILHFCYSGLDG